MNIFAPTPSLRAQVLRALCRRRAGDDWLIVLSSFVVCWVLFAR